MVETAPKILETRVEKPFSFDSEELLLPLEDSKSRTHQLSESLKEKSLHGANLVFAVSAAVRSIVLVVVAADAQLGTLRLGSGAVQNNH